MPQASSMERKSEDRKIGAKPSYADKSPNKGDLILANWMTMR